MSTSLPAVSRRKTILVLSFGVTVALLALGLLAIAVSADACTPTSYSLTSTAPTTNWSDTTKWTPSGYPGQCSGDTANIGLSGMTMNVDVVLQPIQLAITTGCPVAIPTGGSLTLQTSSSATSSSSFTVNGGVFGVASGNSVTLPAAITLNTGNLTVAGALTMSSGAQINANGGRIDGGGTVTIPSAHAMTFSGSSGAMVLSATTIDNFGSVTFSSATNPLSINSGGHIKVESGGAVGLSADGAINTDNVSSPSIIVLSSGTFSKTGGTDSIVNVDVDNAGGTISAGTATLELLGGGTHTGAFNISGSTAIMRFNGTHNFNAGASISTGPLGGWELLGGTFNVNTPLSVPTMKQSGGTLGGSANFSTTTSYNWAGGTQDGTAGGATTLGNSTLTIDPSTAITMNGRTISDANAITYAPTATGSLAIQNGSQLNLQGGTFDLQSDTAIIGDGTSNINVTAGILTKTVGTATSIGCPLNINGTGTIKPVSNTILFGNGGSIGGTTVTVDTSAANSLVKLSGGTTALNGGVTFNSGNLALANSAVLNVNSSYAINNFTQDASSKLTGNTAGLTISGTYNWNGGTIDPVAGPSPVVTIGGGGIMNMNGTTGAMVLTGAATLENNGGTINYAPTTFGLAINSGSTLYNLAGTLNLNGSIGITSDNISSPAIKNQATVAKLGTSTLSVAPSYVDIAGTLNVAGTLQLAGGGSTTGTFGGTGRVEINSAASAFTLSTATPFSGTLAVNGLLSLGAAASVSNLELNTGGTVTAPAAADSIAAGSTFKWTGGTFSGLGSATINGPTDMTALTGTPTISNGFTLTNNGTVTYNPTFSLTLTNTGGGGATFANGASGIFNITGNGTTAVNGSSNVFKNAGTVRKTSGGGTFTMTLPYIQSGGTTDCADPASVIAFNSNAAQINGGSLTATNNTASIDIVGNTLILGGGTLSGSGPLQLKGGTIVVNTATSLPLTFNMSGGTLSAPQSVTIPNASMFNWSGGTISGNVGSPFTVSSGGTLNIDTTNTSLSFTTGPLVINSGGIVNWNAGANSLFFLSGATVNDSGTFTTSVPATLGAATAGSFAVNGQFTHNAANTLTVLLPLNVQTGGTITSSGGGTIALANTSGVSDSGTFDAQSSSIIEFDAGTHQLNPGAALSAGTGTYKVNGGTLSLATNVSAPNVALISGTITGGGNLSTSSTFNWQGGAMSGTGTTTVASGTASFTAGPLSLNRNLTLSGNTTLNASSGLAVGSGVTITNNATFDMQTGNVTCTSCTAFANSGTLQKSTIAGLSTFAVPVTGSGVLNVSLGSFSDLANSNFASANIATGATAILNATTAIGTVSGNGSLQIPAGTTTVAGTLGLTSGGAISVTGGTLTLNGTSAVDTLALGSGTLNGSGGLTVGANSTWSGGSLSGTGTALFNAPLAINGTTGPETLGRNTTFAAPVTYTGPNATNILSVNSGTTITNNATFAFADQNINGTGANFDVAGSGSLLRNSGAGGTLTFGPFVNSAGTNLFTLGTTDFPNGYQQTGGSTTMNGGNLSSGFGFTFAGGSFTGFGAITGNVSNGATWNIVHAGGPGSLAITGNYTQTSGGTLNAKINGTVAGTQYDQLNVSGNVALNGTFAATLGYSPANGDTYKVLTFGTNAPFSDFATKNLPAMTPPGFMQASYVSGPPQALQLTAVTAVADLSAAQAVPPSALHGQNVTITVTITNNGPSTATNVSLADSFANASFVSATLPGGSCTGSNCTLSSLASGSTAVATIVLNANTIGTITNSATVSSSTYDSNNANNATGTASITVSPAADLGISVSATPNPVNAGANATFVITVTNAGPDTAATPAVTASLSTGTISSAPGCTISGANVTCSLASLAAGGSTSITVTAQAPNGSAIPMTLNASVTSTTGDPNPANNSCTGSTNTAGCPTSAPSRTVPTAGATNMPTSGTLAWNNVGAASYKVYFGPAGSGCTTLVGNTTVNNFPYAGLNAGAQYEWRIEAITAGCQTLSTSCLTFTTVSTCPTNPPTLTAPANGATVSSPVNFSWTPVTGAASYTVFAGVNGATPAAIGTTTSTTLSASVGNGPVTWYVTADVGAACSPLTSPSGNFNGCTSTPPSNVAVVGTVQSGDAYTVGWDLNGASRYEIDEATKADFSNAVTQSVTTNSVSYQHSAVTAPLAFYYRVRAFTDCNQTLSANSASLRVVIIPLNAGGITPSVNAPAGTKQLITQIVHVNGLPNGSFPFTATVDQPFMTVTPANGILPPAGLDFTITIDPSGLDNGTVTGTLMLSIATASAGHLASTGSTVSSTPVSINLVTPVSPSTGGVPPANALIIPSVGHLGGINSQWQSDVRVTNAGTSGGKYSLLFTPADGSGMKATTINIGAGETIALDDIIRNWYGVGLLGDSANGVLQIAPTGAGAKDGTVNIQTVASSRTYDVTSKGTLGQYIPAIPFSSFIGAVTGQSLPTILSLQQVRQNDAFRTNLGLVEAAGKSANVVVTAFDANGTKLFDFPVTLAPNEQKQLNGFLAQQGVTSLSDGRFEVKVTGGDGKVTAYASLVDNKSGDPLLISGVPINAIAESNYVLPGVADIHNGFANWQSDVRIFNAGSAPQLAMLTFYPQNNGGDPTTSTIMVNPGEVKQLDGIVKSQFNLANIGGALHVTTASNSSLVVTGRTYNLAGDGSTYGQFIPAVTPELAVGNGDPSLHILQVEESVRYRTNVGFAEVTGKPATVAVSVFVPNAKSTPTATIALGANEYKQFDVLSSLGLSNVYNARVSVKVIGGDGKVTAYGSVIDMTTQDPTFVPAQQ